MLNKNIEKKGHDQHEKGVLHFTIKNQNGELEHYTWEKQYITGLQLREVGKIPSGCQIFLAIKKPWENEVIEDDTEVDLARPGIEHFLIKEKNVKIVLIVNGREKPWTKNRISFEEAVVLAFGSYDPNPNKVYTVTYDCGPHENPEGSMVKGDIVFVKNKMIFNVTATDKS